MNLLSRPLAFLGTTALLLGACSAPDTYQGKIIRGGDEVQVAVRSWVGDVDVEDVLGRLKNGRASAQFRIVNNTGDPLRLRCTFEWRDEDGFLLRQAVSTRSETLIVLRPDQSRILTYTAPTEGAVQFLARIRNAAHEE